jgi:plasmid stabilization system protein ParE
LRPQNPAAARRAGETILQSVQILRHQPHIGRPVEDMPEDYREWVIEFGDSGYVARYRIDAEAVTILVIQPERGRVLIQKNQPEPEEEQYLAIWLSI